MVILFFQNLHDKKFNISELKDIEKNINSINYRFALTGQSWQLLREHYPDIVPKICVRGAIFARMTSDQKQQLVLELMQLGYYVGMDQYLIFNYYVLISLFRQYSFQNIS